MTLNHRVSRGVSQRNLRVQKYRGSSFDENESPCVIGKKGFDVALARSGRMDTKVSGERVTSGVNRLDTMLGGGCYRGASVLITGFPGTAKTTLSGAFAEAACERGERTMFVSFDSDGTEVMRNLASVGIRLERFTKSGMLCLVSARTITGSAETLLVHIKTLAREHGARCLVIDPVSTLAKLILSSNGVTLADIYTAGGEVLMGTLRWEKESAELIAAEVAEVAGRLKRLSLDADEAVLEVRLKSLQTELIAKQAEKMLLERTTASRKGETSRGHIRMRELRGADATKPRTKSSRP